MDSRQRFASLAVHTINQPNELSHPFQQRYSRMKHGDPKAIVESAGKLIYAMKQDPVIAEAIERGDDIILTSSAFGSVPTAIYAVVLAMVPQLAEIGVKAEVVKINRSGNFRVNNYGSMNATERGASLKERKISLSEEDLNRIRGKLVVVVDDIKVTGSHEIAITQLLESTEVRLVRFCYLVSFTKELAETFPQAEDLFNSAVVRTLADLLHFTNDEFVVNARTIKMILSTKEYVDKTKAEMLADLYEYLAHDDDQTILKFYRAATSEDGYCYFPEYVDGFHVLANVAIARGLVSLKEFQQVKNAVVVNNLTVGGRGTYLDVDSGDNLGETTRMYSLMKFGGVHEVKWFASRVAKQVIGELKTPGSGFRKLFERARDNNEHVVMLTPGSRNVVSAQHSIFETAVKSINAWLALNGYPTIIFCKLTRFSSGAANYSELSVSERVKEQRSKGLGVSALPSEAFFAPGVHIIFADDVRISGASADHFEIHALLHGALSCSSIYCLMVDPRIAIANPAFENELNQVVIKGGLDDQVAYILNQPDFRPVQRMLRLILQESNRGTLATFLENLASTEAISRIYVAALESEFYQDSRYRDSVPLLSAELRKRGVLDEDGLVIC